MDLSFFTPNQIQAITIDKNKNVLVSAGAGSGKTEVLTRRVIYFIEEKGYRLSDFLILTFTNLAASEMKERIRKALVDENLPDKDLVGGSSIQTFDSFCLNLVKKYHIKLGLIKDVTIGMNNILEVKIREYLDDIFNELYTNEDKDFLNLVSKYCYKEDRSLYNLVLSIYRKANIEVDRDAFLDNYNRYYDYSLIDEYAKIIALDIKELSKELEVLLHKLPDVICSKANPVIYSTVINNDFVDFLNSSNYFDLLRSFPQKLSANKPRGVEDDNITLFQKAYGKLKDFISSLPNTKDEFKEEFDNSKELSIVLFKIVKELVKRIDEYKLKHMVFEFNDIAKYAMKLLEDEAIRDEIALTYKMIMIDEYQDTSIMQEEYINKIARNNLYMVGDIKQSIYRFRNARCDIFRDKYNLYKKDPTKGIVIDLNTNFRSRKEVLYDINHIFGPMMTYELGGADYKDSHMIEFGNKDYLNNRIETNYHSTVYLYDHVSSSENADKEYLILVKDIIDKIKSNYQVMDYKKVYDSKKKKDVRVPYLRPANLGDFCILVDRSSQFDDIARVLKDHKIPFYIEKDEDITKTSVVIALSSLLKIIKAIEENNYNNDVTRGAYLSLVRSFVFCKNDEYIYNEYTKNSSNVSKTEVVQIIKDLYYKYNNESFSNMLYDIIFDLDMYESLVKIENILENENYINSFIDILKEQESLGYSIDDFIEYLDNIDLFEFKMEVASVKVDAPCVKLMTIHKSKGLEFKIVYYPLLYKEFIRDDSRTGFSKDYGIYLQSSEKKSIIRYLYMEKERYEEDSEKLRLLYVALTRAQEKMIFILTTSEATPILKKLYDELMLNPNSHLGYIEKVNSIASKNIDSKEETLEEGKNPSFYLENLLRYCNNDIEKYKELIKYYNVTLIKPIIKVNDRYYFDSSNYEFNGNLSDNKIINKAFNDYKINIININDFDLIIKSMDKLLVNYFYDYDLDKINEITNILDYIYDFHNYQKERTYNYLDSFLLSSFDYPFFELRIDDLKEDTIDDDNEFIATDLDIKDFKYQSEELFNQRASKDIRIDANEDILELGTKLHFILEITDFLNPDFSIIEDSEERELVKSFLNSDLLKDVKDGEVYKEYEFIDKEKGIHGFIDLMIVYSDHIDIIDYKTSNIDDANYIKQVSVYCDYIKRVFNKKTFGYLYSLKSNRYKSIGYVN